MNSLVKKVLLAETKLWDEDLRYGIVAFSLALFFVNVLDTVRHDFIWLMVPLILLSNLLAFQFRWSRPVTIALRACACLGLLLVWALIIYLICSHR